MKKIVLAASAVFAAAAMTGPALAGKCVIAGGEATMVTEDGDVPLARAWPAGR